MIVTVRQTSNPFSEGTDHPAGSRAMNVDLVVGARVAGGDDEGLSGDGKPKVADESLVQDRMDLLLLVRSPLRETPDLGPRRGNQRVSHAGTIYVESGLSEMATSDIFRQVHLCGSRS